MPPDTFTAPLPAGTFPRLYVPPSDECADDDFAPSAQAVALFEPAGDDDHTTDTELAKQYLVLLHEVGSDLPLGLFGSAAEAVAFSREVRANPDAYADRYYRIAGASPSSLLRPKWLGVSAVVFTGSEPVDRVTLFELD